jgi:AcrR family transcriptional regulator
MNDTRNRTEFHTGTPRAKRRASARNPRRPSGGAHTPDTRERILDTAERLFAERGVAATSVRDITGAAGVNLGAINYHFGTKQELAAEVFRRRLEPVSERQLALLDKVVQKAGAKPPKLEVVLEAMIRPIVENSFAAGKRNVTFTRLMEQSVSEPNSELRRWMRTYTLKIATRYRGLLARAWPSLPPEELLWRIQFTTGAVHQMRQLLGQEDSLPSAMRKGLDADTMIRRVVTFAAAGIRAGT